MLRSATSSAPVVGSAPAEKDTAKGTYAFVSLGCPKNLVDSERMLGLLQVEGYRLVQDPQGADFVVVNTCGFIEQARAESYGTIEEMLELKRRGQVRGVIVSGCLAQREQAALRQRYPEIDHVLGVFARDEIARVADRLIAGLDEQREVFRPATTRPWDDRNRFRVTPKHFAYLKISEGCDRLCTFCSIPRMRGRHVSKPIEQIVDEAAQLAQDGVRELVLVAQDLTYYGLDLYGRPRLAELLQQLEAQVPELDWIRLMYLYPMYVTDELIDTVASSRRVLPYLDMPLQHVNDQMLRRMARRVTRAQIEQLIDKLRRRIDQLVLRTTFIVGFPGETEQQFLELVEFVQQMRLERVGVFTYSLEPDTPSARLPDQVPEEEKLRRRDHLMQVQQQVAFEFNARQVGRRRDVLLDMPLQGEKNVWLGRTWADAPEVDSVVYVTGKRLRAGQIVPCEIVTWKDYDLVAAPVGKPR